MLCDCKLIRIECKTIIKNIATNLHCCQCVILFFIFIAIEVKKIYFNDLGGDLIRFLLCTLETNGLFDETHVMNDTYQVMKNRFALEYPFGCFKKH